MSGPFLLLHSSKFNWLERNSNNIKMQLTEKCLLKLILLSTSHQRASLKRTSNCSVSNLNLTFLYSVMLSGYIYLPRNLISTWHVFTWNYALRICLDIHVLYVYTLYNVLIKMNKSVMPYHHSAVLLFLTFKVFISLLLLRFVMLPLYAPYGLKRTQSAYKCSLFLTMGICVGV